MKKWITAPLLALALALPAVGFAQAASPAKLNLAHQAIQLQQGAEQDALLADMSNAVATAMIEKWATRAIEGVPEYKRQKVAEQLDAELEKLYNDIHKTLKAVSIQVESEDLIDLYAQKFTEDELNTMLIWFKSSAFKTYQEATPDLAEAYMTGVMQRTNTKIKDLQGAFDAKAAAIINAAK